MCSHGGWLNKHYQIIQHLRVQVLHGYSMIFSSSVQFDAQWKYFVCDFGTWFPQLPSLNLFASAGSKARASSHKGQLAQNGINGASLCCQRLLTVDVEETSALNWYCMILQISYFIYIYIWIMLIYFGYLWMLVTCSHIMSYCLQHLTQQVLKRRKLRPEPAPAKMNDLGTGLAQATPMGNKWQQCLVDTE